MNKHLTRGEYLQLLGLVTLAKRHNAILTELEKAAQAITGEAAHTVDIVSGFRELDEGLDILGITVDAEAVAEVMRK
jgi:hypothetical protein